MSDLPVIPGAECARALERAGFRLKRQKRRHPLLRREAPFPRVVVHTHKVLDRGTVRAIISPAGLSVDEFIKFP